MWNYGNPFVDNFSQSSREINNGMTDHEISGLKVENYKEDPDLPEDEKKVCSICDCDLQTGEQVNILECTHVFHCECIGAWLKVKANCPNCRANIRPNPDVHVNPDNDDRRVEIQV